MWREEEVQTRCRSELANKSESGTSRIPKVQKAKKQKGKKWTSFRTNAHDVTRKTEQTN